MLRGRKRSPSKAINPWYSSTSLLLNGVSPTYVSQFDTNRYYSSNTGSRAFPYGVVRTGAALMFNSSGQLVWNNHNLISRSATTGATLGVVGSGGVMPTGWHRAPASGITHEIVNITENYIDIRIYGTNSSGGLVYPHIRFIPSGAPIGGLNNAPYTVSANVGIIGGSATGFNILCSLTMNWWNGTSYVSQTGSTTTPTTEYKRVTTNGTMPSSGVNGISPQFDIAIADGSSVDVTLRIGQPQLEFSGPNSPQPFVYTNGSAVYLPRFCYDPVTLSPIGIHIERQRTNEISNRNNVGVATGTTITTGESFSGFWDSKRITGDGLATSHFAASNSTTPAATEVRHCYAVVKAQSGDNRIQLTVSANFAATDVFANFDVISGTVLFNGAGVSNSYVYNMGNGWYQIGFDFTSNATPTGGAGSILALIAADNAPRIPASTSTSVFDVLAYGNCSGAGFTFMIPTFSANVTRAGDVLNELTSTWLDTTKGTIYVSATKITPSSGGSFSNIGDSGGVSQRNQFRWTNSNVGHIVAVGGVVQTTAATAINITSRNIKAAYRYNNVEQMLCANATLSASAGNITSLPTTQSNIFVGSLGTSSELLDGWIKEFRYYADNSASNAQLQTLTT